MSLEFEAASKTLGARRGAVRAYEKMEKGGRKEKERKRSQRK
jgi:hypothetical protein